MAVTRRLITVSERKIGRFIRKYWSIVAGNMVIAPKTQAERAYRSFISGTAIIKIRNTATTGIRHNARKAVIFIVNRG